MYEPCKCEVISLWSEGRIVAQDEILCESCKNNSSDDEFINNLVKGE